jgi:predicted ABC-type ATPase
VASAKRPRCIVIAGSNGSGKTTFARDFLPDGAGVVHFINADLIASGLSPLDPKLAAVAAGRLVLAEMQRLAALRVDFAFESTLSGVGYVRHLQSRKAAGYRIEIVYLRLRQICASASSVEDSNEGGKQGRHHGDPGVARLVQQLHAQPRLDARVFITQSADAR